MCIKQKVLMKSEYQKMKRLLEKEKLSFKNRKTARCEGNRKHQRVLPKSNLDKNEMGLGATWGTQLQRSSVLQREKLGGASGGVWGARADVRWGKGIKTAWAEWKPGCWVWEPRNLGQPLWLRDLRALTSTRWGGFCFPGLLPPLSPGSFLAPPVFCASLLVHTICCAFLFSPCLHSTQSDYPVLGLDGVLCCPIEASLTLKIWQWSHTIIYVKKGLFQFSIFKAGDMNHVYFHKVLKCLHVAVNRFLSVNKPDKAKSQFPIRPKASLVVRLNIKGQVKLGIPHWLII